MVQSTSHNPGHNHAGHDHGLWTHDHHFLGHGHERAEAKARLATLITAGFMLVEIAAGFHFRSMALLADGVHMATHVGALGLAAGAYWLARRHAGNARFTFGSGKFGDLAAFASAIILGIIALGVAIESIGRLTDPVAIDYSGALLVAAIGFGVNLLCALILRDHHHADAHGAEQEHAHASHGRSDQDHNMRAAYVHVMADAATSILAVVALTAGLIYGLHWLDPLVGLFGAGIIGWWATSLIRDSGMILLDAEADPVLAKEIRSMIESEMGARVADLHLWRVGPGHHSLIVSVVSPDLTNAEAIKAALRGRHPDLSHVTVEVAVCADCAVVSS